MRLKETGTADKLFAIPGCAHLRAQNLLKVNLKKEIKN